MSKFIAVLLCAVLVSLSAGCGDAADKPTVRIAITTSLRDSGLLDKLLPEFQKECDCDVVVIAKGTGAALAAGEQGDVSLVLVHSPAAEEAFVAKGHATERLPLMKSEFLIAGPESDPAAIKGLAAPEALRRIADAKATFVSRGDDSGTHNREMSLWKAAGGLRKWKDYLEAGRGMGATLMTADETLGYVLIDSGTFANMRDKVELVALVRGGPTLDNPYHIMKVVGGPEGEGERLAAELARFLTGAKGQAIIRNFEIKGERIFIPARREFEDG